MSRSYSTDDATTVAYLGDREMYLDEPCGVGQRIEIRKDFDDESSPVVGIYTLVREADRWVLR